VEIVVSTTAIALMALADDVADHRSARLRALDLWDRRR